VLNRRTTFATNSAGHSSAQLQVSIGGIDDGINVGIGNVAPLQGHLTFPTHLL
jgi:hypothetical protein